MNAYKPVEAAYLEQINVFMRTKKAVRIQYFTDINEFITTVAIIKTLFEKDGATYMQLSSGEEVRLDKLVRIEDKPAPGYDTTYFACDI